MATKVKSAAVQINEKDRRARPIEAVIASAWRLYHRAHDLDVES
jgi:hypothetical protein